MAEQYIDVYDFVVREELDDHFFNALRSKLQAYNRLAAPALEPPDAVPLNIRVENGAGEVLGGVAALTYWGWLVVKLLIVDESLRGQGIGRQLLHAAHRIAMERGCHSAQTMTYDFQALKFYQKHGYCIVGELRDYPEGYSYYWLRKELTNEDGDAAYTGRR